MEPNHYSRRQALKSTTCGISWLAFAALATRESQAAKGLRPKEPHFAARAKRVIMLTMPGGPSHVDTFDYKPQLNKDNGKAGKYGKLRGQTLMGSPFEFKKRGESGLWISELFPHVATMADDLCLLRSMHTDVPDHTRAQLQMHTGKSQFQRPSLGVWSLYGLGSESENLPGYVWLDPGKGNSQILGNGFLPPENRGTGIGVAKGADASAAGGARRGRRASLQTPTSGVQNIANADGLSRERQRMQLDFIQSLNEEKLAREAHQPGVEGVIESFELAFRMQDAVPDVVDIDRESEETKALYGIGEAATEEFGRKCLMARRFAEAGVRFIELGHSPGWDTHGNLRAQLAKNCGETDKPIAGLLMDLKRRDMLKDTLVLWSGEFGRTPHGQNGDGRDHNAKGYTSWMAGGGVKGGFSYGATDEYGYEAVENKMHIHDWHATILHLLGLDHENLTYRYAGRDFRLTDVHGKVAKDILA
ncbi:MAG: DUF1501 domain-containing protein [Verrucomicrobiota bacterium]